MPVGHHREGQQPRPFLLSRLAAAASSRIAAIGIAAIGIAAISIAAIIIAAIVIADRRHR